MKKKGLEAVGFTTFLGKSFSDSERLSFVYFMNYCSVMPRSLRFRTRYSSFDRER